MATSPDADGDIIAISGDAIKEDLERHWLQIAHIIQAYAIPSDVLSGRMVGGADPARGKDYTVEAGYTMDASGAMHIHEVSLVRYPRFTLGPRLEFWPMGKPSDRVLKLEGRRMRHYRMTHGKHAGRARRAG